MNKREKTAERLSAETGRVVEAISDSGPIGFMYSLDGTLCRNAADVRRRVQASRAAATLGSIRSEKKAASSRENGKKGGRPRTVTITPIRGIEHEFSAIVSGTRHIAYGEYTSRDVYTLLHAPTQNDFDAVSQAMDDPRTKVIKEEA